MTREITTHADRNGTADTGATAVMLATNRSATADAIIVTLGEDALTKEQSDEGLQSTQDTGREAHTVPCDEVGSL